MKERNEDLIETLESISYLSGVLKDKLQKKGVSKDDDLYKRLESISLISSIFADEERENE